MYVLATRTLRPNFMNWKADGVMYMISGGDKKFAGFFVCKSRPRLVCQKQAPPSKAHGYKTVNEAPLAVAVVGDLTVI